MGVGERGSGRRGVACRVSRVACVACHVEGGREGRREEGGEGREGGREGGKEGGKEGGREGVPGVPRGYRA